MNQQINGAVIQKQNENNAQVSDCNRFAVFEKVIDKFVAMGSSLAYMSSYANLKIAKEHGLSLDDLEGCKRIAFKQIKANQEEATKQAQRPQEVLNGACAYYYAQGYTKNENTSESNDGMDSLSSLGSYNRLMFGIKS